jgi:hypothetical protein
LHLSCYWMPHRWPTYCQLVAAAISNVLKHTQMLKVVVMLRALQQTSSLDELVRQAMKVNAAPNSSGCPEVVTTCTGRQAFPFLRKLPPPLWLSPWMGCHACNATRASAWQLGTCCDSGSHERFR